MTLEDIRKVCSALPGVTEDIKWGNDLCFSVGGKMFLVAGLESVPTGASFKVPDEAFDEMTAREGFGPAPYLARYKWVMVDDISRLPKKEWKELIEESYRLVASKLAGKKKGPH